MISVELTETEVREAVQVGIDRNIAAIKDRRSDRFETEAGWQAHIIGALGEKAFCKAYDLPWSKSVNTFKTEADVGVNIEIRTRASLKHGMIVRKDDDPKRVYVLVVGSAFHFKIVGWLSGVDAQLDCWLKNYGGHGEAYFVDKAALHPMDLLKVDKGDWI